MTSVEYGDDPYMTRIEVLADHGIVDRPDMIVRVIKESNVPWRVGYMDAKTRDGWFRLRPARRSMKRLTPGEAQRIAANVVPLLEQLRLRT
jgi:hypothetical protein